MAKIARGSRYQDAIPFTPPDGDRPAFAGIRPRSIDAAAGVLEHVVRENERLDLLALHYYNDPRRWWRIADANPEVVFGGDLVVRARVGSVILIPRAASMGRAP
jgi:nucleoid-associated protein YgaU